MKLGIPLRIAAGAAILFSALVAGCGSDSSGLLGSSTAAAAESDNSSAIQGPGFGLRDGRRGPGPIGGLLLVDPLKLTDEQQAQADAIHDNVHAANRLLLRTARSDARAVLTDEQKATLDALPGHFEPGSRLVLEDQLALSDEQKSQIKAIADALHDQVKANHDAARDQFRAILTDEQIATLDEIESNRPHPPEGFGGPPPF